MDRRREVREMKSLACLFILAALLSPPQQQALTNEAITKLVKSGLSQDTIVSIVKTQPGTHSANALTPPVEFLIYVPEGTEITEYQLLRLRQHSDTREFRTVSGGVFHQSSGAKRDLAPFNFKKVAERTFQVTLTADVLEP